MRYDDVFCENTVDFGILLCYNRPNISEAKGGGRDDQDHEESHEYHDDRRLRRCCFLPIDRENARNALTTINAAADLIRAHECSFAIYPEGTRSKSGKLLPWHAGSLKIAQKANVPIVVATIEGTERIAHNVPWRRTHVYLSIREVIPAETVKATKTNALTEGIRSKMIAELGK